MSYAIDFMSEIKAKNPGEPEFHQAVQEVAESLAPVFDKSPHYRKAKILERICVPERRSVSACPGSTTRARFRSTAAIASR